MGVCTILGLTKKRLGSPQVEESAILAQFKSLEAFTSFAAFKVEKRVPLPVQVPVTLSFYWETLHFFLHPVQYAIVEWGNLSETSFCVEMFNPTCDNVMHFSLSAVWIDKKNESTLKQRPSVKTLRFRKCCNDCLFSVNVYFYVAHGCIYMYICH